MAEFLPSIDIAVSVEPREFLERMAVIGEQAGQFTVERHYDAIKDGKLDVINFRYLGSSPHMEVGGQLIGRDDLPGRVLVEMRAHWWDPDPLTRASYCTAASELMLPLLNIYNRTYDTRYRFRVQNTVLKAAKLSTRTKMLFERFVVLANTASLHPLDWDRFYALVREGRQQLPGYELRAMLIARGFSNEKAEHLSEVYAHLWNFKRRKW
ncbi:hypothetical protein PX699_02330 [Sphingobium sp. H39-3-25]|uniref:hypothetical protein n=1 Tax=Sphingobium arseniciresistens TaxID=3030834 RepID=UPI0023B9EFCA|nr:hypothetical protein [Sphingobium arseniciresistens]